MFARRALPPPTVPDADKRTLRRFDLELFRPAESIDVRSDEVGASVLVIRTGTHPRARAGRYDGAVRFRDLSPMGEQLLSRVTPARSATC